LFFLATLVAGRRLREGTHGVTELFRDRGLKVTPQRQCIFGVLQGNGSHPTAHAVFEVVREEMPTIAVRVVHCDFAGLSLPTRQQQDFTVAGTEIVFRGLCTPCSRATSHQKESAREEKDGHV
jgi:Fe2+ or Zn2+ uptake regulation protein